MYSSESSSDSCSINEIEGEIFTFEQKRKKESQYSNYKKRKNDRKKYNGVSLIDNPFAVPLQHNNFLDMDENDDDLFPDVNNITYDSDSIFTKTDFSTNNTIEEDTTNNNIINHNITKGNVESNSNFPQENPFIPKIMNEHVPVKKRGCIRIKKNTKKSRTNKTTEQSLIAVGVLPEKYRHIFNFPNFNKMQSMAFYIIYQTNFNTIISSPTGSGKTVLFELAILKLIINLSETDLLNLKILYIAPTKSLCTEILNKWNSIHFLGLTVGMFTGDSTYKESENIKNSNIIITTPEKWDLLTRKWNDYSKLFQLIKLILVDEIHTIGETRGATLEVVLTRMNTLCTNIRFIAASATIPNITDIAEWLKENNGKPAKTLTFGDEFRQVSLKKHVYGFSFYNNKNEFQKDAFYNTQLCEIILKHWKQKPVLIFCPTRSSTISTAKYLVKYFLTNQLTKSTSQNFKIDDNALKECVCKGIAFHNAGLSLKDRSIVEENFRSGTIKILCSTSTLAVGVNLPAYLAIIKGTSIWNVHANKDYSKLDILQMIGRAGRPQFEKEGCAIIITDANKKEHFENLLEGNDMLESTLHLNMYEHLCSEISLQTIKSSNDAIKWLRSTFLYVRYHKNPKFYWQIKEIVNHQKDADSQLISFYKSLIKELIEEQLIEVNEDKYICSLYGQAMVRHYIIFETMKSFIKMEKNLTIERVLTLLVKSKEFKELKIRQNERRFYKEINMSPLIRFPFLTEKKQGQIIDQTYQKISLLIQYELGGLEFPLFEWSFKIRASVIQDRLLILRHCQRLLKCMIDTFITKKDGNSLKNALFLLRSINGNTWEDSTGIIRQLKLIGLVAHRKLVNQGVSTLQDISNLSEEQLEYYLGLRLGLGTKIKEDLSLIPNLKIRMKPDKYEIVDNNSLNITFKIEISAEYKSTIWHGKYLSIDFESVNNRGEMLDFRRIFIKQLRSPKSFKIKTVVNSSDFRILFLLNCQEIAGIGKTVDFLYNDIDAKYRQIIKNNSNFTTLDKYLSIDDQSSENLLSDDSILQYLEEEKKLIGDCEQNHTPFFSKGTSTCNRRITNNPKKMPLFNNNIVVHSVNKNLTTFSTGPKTENNILDVQDSTTIRRLLPNGNYECNHFCKQKNQCRHYCCKDGIPKKTPKIVRPSKYFNISNSSDTPLARQSLHKYDYDEEFQAKNNFETPRRSKSPRYEKNWNSNKPFLNVPSIEEILLESDNEDENCDKIDSWQDISQCENTLLEENFCVNKNKTQNGANSDRDYNHQLSPNSSLDNILKERTVSVDNEHEECSSCDSEESVALLHNFFGSDVEIS